MMILENFYFNAYAIPFLASAVLFAFVGIYVLKQSFKSILHLSFFGICLPLVIWLAATALLLVSQNPWWIRFSINSLYLGVSFISLSFFAYSSIWLKYAERQKGWMIFGFLAALTFIPVIWYTPLIVTGYMQHSWGHYSLLSPIGGTIYLSFFAFYMMFFFFNLIKGYRKAADQLRKKQLKVIIIGFLLAYIGSVDFLPCYRIEIFPIGAFTTLILVSTLFYTIIRYRLLDIQTVIHKTIMWVTTSVLFVVPLGIISYFAKDWIASLDSTTFAMLVFAALSCFIPYIRIVQPKIDQLFQRRLWDLNRVFKEFTEDLVHLKSLEDLVKHILQTIAKTVYPEDASLYLWDEEKSECLVFSNRNQTFKILCKKHETFFRSLAIYDSLLQPDYIEIDPRLKSIEREALEYFNGSQARICVPLVLDERLIGMINLNRKTNFKEYSISELRFLADLRSSAAIAISNSLRLIAMQASLRKWNEELERQVEERTKELKEAQAKLIQAEKLATIGTLAGGVAHEINNPLAAILTNAQMLLSEVRDAGTSESLQLIEEAAERCRMIVQKLMKYSRKSPQGETLEPVDLNEVIDHAIAFLQYQLEQENVGIVRKLNASGRISGNANELSQVLTNLILNARDALRNCKQGALVEIRTFDRGPQIVLEVEDNGEGIPENIIPKIFDPFFTTKDVGKGTGLGLSIVQGIIEKHNGQIGVKSKINLGTVMTVTFPSQGVKSKGASETNQNTVKRS